MKKLLSFLVVSVLLLTLIPVAFAGNAPELVIGSIEINEGDTTASVAVEFKNNPGITYAKFYPQFDSNVLSISAKSDIEGGLFSNSELKYAAKTGAITYNYENMDSGNMTDSGVIFTINFNVATGAKAGTYAITFNIDEISNFEGVEIQDSVTNTAVGVTVMSDPFVT